MAMKAAVKPELTQKMFNLSSLNFIRLLRVVITPDPSVTEGVMTTRSNRMKFRVQLQKLETGLKGLNPTGVIL